MIFDYTLSHMPQQTLHIHLVSDSTGETVHQVARACLAQFTDVKPVRACLDVGAN